MPKKTKPVPINTLADGIAIGRLVVDELNGFDVAAQAHRDDYHLFLLQEKGATPIEIDFQKYQLEPLSIIYINPNQVHRMGMVDKGTVSIWLVKTERLKPDYLNLLESITPVKPLALPKESFAVISQAVSLCIKLSQRKHEKLYHSLLQDSCNTLVGLIVSQYVAQAKSTDTLSRIEMITKAFKALLERNFTTAKKPADYAQFLHISTHYLTECVKRTTGYSVSHHIQQRIILEAKRWLYHSDQSVKEIAFALGYDDYPYFSRLFTKVASLTPLAFRRTTHD